jgi:hypothetical protein
MWDAKLLPQLGIRQLRKQANNNGGATNNGRGCRYFVCVLRHANVFRL